MAGSRTFLPFWLTEMNVCSAPHAEHAREKTELRTAHKLTSQRVTEKHVLKTNLKLLSRRYRVLTDANSFL